MTTRRTPRVLVLVSAAAFLAGAAIREGACGETGLVGPPIGNLKYRTTISPGGDADDFTASFVTGDRLDAAVTALRGKSGAAPSLRPALVLVDPDGFLVTGGVRTTAGGATLKGFSIDKPGLWAVRVTGRDGTSGDAAVAFRVKPAAKSVVKGQRLGGEQAQSVAHRFAACDGAKLDVTIVLPKGGGQVELASLRDAYGADVLDGHGVPVVESASAKNGQIRLRGVTLHGAVGTYELWVQAPAGPARYDATISVTSPKRPTKAGIAVLPALEPRLDDVDEPIVAAPGTTVRLTGVNFSARRPTTVLFDGVRGTKVVVGGGGRTLDVVVPARTGPSVVSVAVLDPSRVGTVHPRYLAFIPPPACEDLVDTWTRQPVRSSSTTSGRLVSVLGSHFEAGYRVLVGGVQATTPMFVSETELRFTLPVVPHGDHVVAVSDAFGRSGSSEFLLHMKTPPSFAAAPYAPGAIPVGQPATLTISGAAFAPSDVLFFAGQPTGFVDVDATKRQVELPALAAGTYTVRMTDDVGTTVDGPALLVKPPPTLGSVTVTAGDLLGTSTIPLRGGTTIQLDGTDFHATDVVTVGAVKVTSFLSSTSTRKVFLAPAGTAGPADVTVTDAALQSTSIADAVAYAGLADVSSSRAPAAGSADDFAAVRGAVADLDGDTAEDDVVLVAPLGASSGTRSERTRVLIGNASGKLVDTTGTAVPAAFSDAAGVDTWDATCVAIGDLDDSGGPDIVIAGDVSAQDAGAAQVRWLANDGTGRFGVPSASALPTRDVPVVTGAYYAYGYGTQTVTIFDASPQRGRPQAVAVGDVDGDGSPDVVVGTDEFQSRSTLIDLGGVDFSQSPPAVASLDPADYEQFLPATRIYENRLGTGQGLVDVSLARLPPAGVSTETASHPAALHCRDLALADLNHDGELDLVVAWDDPTTVSAYGLRTQKSTGASADQARTATRILLNTGGGSLTDDATDTWMPTPSAPEYWQADRVAARDLDGDGWPELVLVVRSGLDRYTGSETHKRTSLRVLRNDRTHFTDVTSTAVPPVDSATQDDWRGGALAIRDVDGDGRLDIVVGTTSQLTGSGGAVAARTRILFGLGGLTFARAPGFAERTTVDSGEADDVLVVGDLAGAGEPVMMLVSMPQPSKAPAAAPHARTQEWVK